MMEALSLARRGVGLTSPNPAVGALVVRHGRVVGRGWHRRAGTPHAEFVAIEEAGEAARGADLYCTLEPCNHSGRTGPCTERIIDAGIRRVFFGCRDPNPRVKGGGALRLSRAGIKLNAGILEAECSDLNRAFLKWAKTGLPWITIKAAASLDGKIATRTGDSKWISSERSRLIGHRLRFEADAILVGAGTVLHDNPLLTVRIPGAARKKPPLRVVLDWRLDVGPGAKMYRDKTGPVAVFASKNPPEARAAELRAHGVEIVRVPGRGNGADLKRLLVILGERDVTHLLVEGGSGVHGAFVDQGFFDEIHLFVAPMLLGGAGARPFVGGEGVGTVRAARRLVVRSFERVGDDFHITARPAGR
ncbi:MAG: bifunctional diaminohydroxyphosphoribosylaminopyrimidine deaminase/5-amino-6-(5-phosphoribosylamino)uracil reductase RibD [Deltaproteobacteria bacterium]|nr:bifunctional diaminohydroxyphosphoribosylaminopyrimidine deaminase/5-amino-6-(5-phosphoribosylamino)uracil reductase RibD [Deltaproteobacteria bacterium]